MRCSLGALVAGFIVCREVVLEKCLARQPNVSGSVEDEPVATGFSGEQELEQKAQAAAVRRAGVQAVEACSTGQAATIQASTACEDRDAVRILPEQMQ